jgi:hypothetical protein
MAVTPQLLLTPKTRALTAATVEPWLTGAAEAVDDPRRRELILDLRAVTQCEPYALAALHCVVRYLAGADKAPFLILPEDERLLADLYRLRFPEAMQPFTANQLEIALDPRDAAETGVAPRLLEVMAAARPRVMAHLGFDAGDMARLEAAVIELCRNVWDHAGTMGIVAAQLTRQPRTERPIIQVGVADLGIGIKASLAARYLVAAWSDAEAILHAVRPGVSRYDTRRGIGLTQALETARRADGALVIRSGTARVSLPDRRLATGSLFPGTQIALELRGR